MLGYRFWTVDHLCFERRRLKRQLPKRLLPKLTLPNFFEVLQIMRMDGFMRASLQPSSSNQT
jgi:hypothetical protein